MTDEIIKTESIEEREFYDVMAQDNESAEKKAWDEWFYSDRVNAHMEKGIFAEVVSEMASQDKKWSPDRNLDPLLWNAILGEEVGEVSKAILEGDENLRQELIQVAAVAIQFIECIDRNEVRHES